MKGRGLLVKVLIVIAITIAAIITVFAVFVIPKMEEGLKVLDNLDFGELKLSSLADGSYQGSYGAGIVKATVSVVIKDHKIESIKILKHDNGRGKAAESITKDVIANQSVQVDVISGATYSSKVILKAIENALMK